MTFRSLQLLFPVLVALHNAEEAILLPRWKHRCGPWFGKVEPRVFRFAAAVFTGLALGITLLSVWAGPRTLWGNATFGYMAAILINSVFPHITVSIAKRTWMPGVFTAAALNVPVLAYLGYLALREGYVSVQDAFVSAVALPLGLLAIMPVVCHLGVRCTERK